MEMDIGFKTHAYGDFPVDKILKHIRACGYGSVELCLENAELSLARLDGTHIGRVRKELKSLQLKACGVSHHANYVLSQGAFQELKTAIPIVPELGADKLVITSGNSEAKKKDQEWKSLVTRTKELLQIAKAYKLHLALEPAPGNVVETIEEAQKFIEECRSPFLGLVLDIAHLHISEKDPFAAIEKVAASHVLLVHLNDIKRQQNVHLIPGEGDLKIQQYVAAFMGAGYQGTYVIDITSLDAHYAAPRAIAALKKILQQPPSLI